jgi:chromosome segregation ATPase
MTTGLEIPSTEEAKWRTLYDALREAEYGTSYTYDELNKMAGDDVDDIRADRWIVDRTRKELVRLDKRYLENLRGVGYRIVHPDEHLKAGNHYRGKSMRAAGRSVKVLEATDLAKIEDPAVRTKIVELENRMGRLQQQLRHQETRLASTERTTERLRADRDDHEDRLAAIETKMRRMAGEDTSTT